MSVPPRLPNKESIRAQLKEIGYANVPDEVLDEFMVDMTKLYTSPSDSYGWSTEESDYEQRSGVHRNVRGNNERQHTRAEQPMYNNNSESSRSRQQHQHQQYQQQQHQQYQHETSEYSEYSDNSQYQHHQHQQHQHQQHHQHQHQHQQHHQHQQYHKPAQRVHHNPPPQDHHYPQQLTTYHPPPHHNHREYRTSESEYETESAEEGVYDGEAYIPSHGIHITPHQQNKYSHSSSDEKENYYRHANQPTRTQPPSYAPAARKSAPPRHQQPVYESDYSSAVNDEYASDDPYYRHAPYPYYTNTSRQYASTSNDEYYSEDDDSSLTRQVSRSSMASESRYPGGKPNSSGVIWARKSENGRAFAKSDPVSRYHEVQRAWSQDPFLRSQSSNKNPKVHIPYEPPWKPPRKDLSLMRPDYVVPTEKRRDSLRFSVRAKMMS